MDDFKNNNVPEGKLNGFDSVNGTDTPQEIESTVASEDGFYTKQRQDIIQDNIIRENSQQKSTEKTSYKSSFSQDNFNNQIYYKPPKRKKKSKKHSTGVVIAACILSAVIGLTGGILGAYAARFIPNNLSYTDNSTDKDTSPNNVNINIEETAESVVEAVAKKVTPSVIGIRTTTSVINFFGGSSEASGEGSGVIYSKDGYIITNYHVISDAISNKSGSKIEVFLDNNNSKSYLASVVGYHISADLAVIKINASNLTPIEISNSDNLKVGQYVITVGNPGGLEFMDSVTYGVISGLERVVSSDSNIELIQTDAAINPGNSGGALVNTKGQLVGINSSKIVSEEFEGMGFAIPSNIVISICDNIIKKENSPEPYVGISISETYTPEVLQYYNYPVGAVVLSVSENSPAHQAGIRKGDIITVFDDVEITKYQVLEQCIKDSEPNKTVTVKIYRSGRYYSAKLTIGSNNQID